MHPPLHNISFPLTEPGQLDQDEAFFTLRERDREL